MNRYSNRLAQKVLRTEFWEVKEQPDVRWHCKGHCEASQEDSRSLLVLLLVLLYPLQFVADAVVYEEFGFALAFVILLDAMIVRIYLVPSVMILLQKWNWWAPGRLQRVRREEKKRNKK